MIRIIIGIWCIFVYHYSLTCDICGGASSSFSMGMLPNSKHHFIGLRHTSRLFESSDLHNSSRKPSKELFTSSDLILRYKLSQRFQFVGIMPYIHNNIRDSLKTTNVDGIGDLNLLCNFVFVETSDSLSKKIKQSGTIGLGIKTPIGKAFILGFNELNMLPGTGSWDFITSLNYAIQYKNIGLQNESSFTYKTANKYGYQFGNALNINQILFYRWVINQNWRIIPQIGVNYSYNWKDWKNGKISEDTYNGGSLLNNLLGLQLLYQNWGFSAQVFLPIYQELNSGFVHQKHAFRFSMNYFIKTKK